MLFVLCLLISIFVAWLAPWIGEGHGPFSLRHIADYGVQGIFFGYGVTLGIGKIVRGLANWRLHLAVHLATFLIFPLITLLAYGLFSNDSTRTLWIGIAYVGALPTTVSSSVTMVSLARGNVPAAIFNAGISSLLGVVFTPLWMSLLLTSGEHDFDFLTSFRGLALLVALPLILGMVLNPLWGEWFTQNRKFLRYFDQTVVLLIVYTSFCESFGGNAFEGVNVQTLFSLNGGMFALFCLVYGILYIICRLCRFDRGDSIAVLFCGSKKSLMHGTAMAVVLFVGSGLSLGVVLLPIMIYHALQLIVVSLLATRYAATYSSQL